VQKPEELDELDAFIKANLPECGLLRDVLPRPAAGVWSVKPQSKAAASTEWAIKCVVMQPKKRYEEVAKAIGCEVVASPDNNMMGVHVRLPEGMTEPPVLNQNDDKTRGFCIAKWRELTVAATANVVVQKPPEAAVQAATATRVSYAAALSKRTPFSPTSGVPPTSVDTVVPPAATAAEPEGVVANATEGAAQIEAAPEAAGVSNDADDAGQAVAAADTTPAAVVGGRIVTFPATSGPSSQEVAELLRGPTGAM
jgi:hypothetical protein